MVRRLFLSVSVTVFCLTLIGCSDKQPISVVTPDGVTSASALPGGQPDGQWSDQRQLVTFSRGYNNLTYCFTLSNLTYETSKRNYISCKRQTTASFEETSWPQPYLWRDELSFIPVWGGLAAGYHTPTSSQNTFVFAINSANNKIMYKREIGPSSGTWQAWKQIKESVAFSVRPPVYAGHAGGGGAVITVFAIDNATNKIRAFQKEPTVNGDENQWTTYLVGDIAVKNYCLVTTDNFCVIFAATSDALYKIASTNLQKYTKIGPSSFICSGDLKITNGGMCVAQKASGIYMINSTTESLITNDCPKHFDVASTGNSSSSEGFLMYLTGSGTNTSIKLLSKNTSNIWSQVSTGSYPNQAAYPVDQMCIKAYNYPCDNRVVFFGNYNNIGFARGASAKPGFFDIWQLYKVSDWTGKWKNLGNLYSY